jgi:hypothetical protein
MNSNPVPTTASSKEMARILGISDSALNKQRSCNPDQGPPFLHMGRRVVYPLTGPSGFYDWVAKQARGGGL